MPKGTPPDDIELWKRRFYTTAFDWFKLAPRRPGRGVVTCNRDTPICQLYAWDMPTGHLNLLTNRPEGISAYEAFSGFLAFDGDYAYYLDDEGGNEIGHLVRVPFEGGAPEDLTPEMKPYTLRGVDVSHTGNLLAFNPVNEDGFQICCLDLGPEGQFGTPRQLYRNEYEVWMAIPSHQGELVACISTERAKMRRYSTLVFDTVTGEQVGELWDGLEYSVEAVAFAPLPGDMRLLARTSRSGFVRPVIWNPLSGERTDLELPELVGEVHPLAWSPDVQQILLAHFDMASPQLYLYDLLYGVRTRLKHPPGNIGICDQVQVDFGPGDELFAVWTDASHPQRIVALDAKGKSEPRAVLAPDEELPGHPWRSVTFPSSDGQIIQGWLAVPEGEGPFPVILYVHGGPHIATTHEFWAPYQMWPDHGFAFLALNFRGSTLFGKAFKEQIWGDIGHWELEDMVAARDWLVEQGIAKPDKILLFGLSYGGFLTLFGLGKRPDLWAGGLALVPGTDWVVGYEDSSDALRAATRLWMGGTPEEKPEQYRVSSPITYVEEVRAPVLIAYGRHDTRTPPRESEVYIDKMRALGKPVEVIVLDRGHATGDIEQEIDTYQKILSFALGILSSD